LRDSMLLINRFKSDRRLELSNNKLGLSPLGTVSLYLGQTKALVEVVVL
jgi:hypothetical protein